MTDTRSSSSAALGVVAAGAVAALHIGKLPPALPALQQALGLTLVQAGFLLSLVQFAGMALGLVLGLAGDALGPRRSLVTGLLVLAAASAAGGAAASVPALMLLRAGEGFGFLLVVLPAPGLVRRLSAPGRANAMMGLWGAYMPAATATALLAGPLVISAWTWRGWWWLLAALTAATALAVQRGLPAVPPASRRGWAARLGRTLGAPAPWALALSFAVYSGQWLAVIGFLPTLVRQAGLDGGALGALTALAAGVNAIGNFGAGQLLQRGWPPRRLLRSGFVLMALSTAVAYADLGAPPLLRYAAVLLFSMGGGLVPATLFALAVRAAPGEDTVATTVGWMQQWSALGQFAGPPLVAWVASASGGWQHTWWVTGACSLAGFGLAGAVHRLLEKKRYAAIPA